MRTAPNAVFNVVLRRRDGTAGLRCGIGTGRRERSAAVGTRVRRLPPHRSIQCERQPIVRIDRGEARHDFRNHCLRPDVAAPDDAKLAAQQAQDIAAYIMKQKK
jgi:hypothetical protein